MPPSNQPELRQPVTSSTERNERRNLLKKAGEVNITSEVEITLTERGKEILSQTERGQTHLERITDSNKLQLQLSTIADLFSDSMNMGFNPPFKPTITQLASERMPNTAGEINLSDRMEITFNAQGRDILSQTESPEFYLNQATQNNKIQLPLSEIMRIFGKNMTPGLLPFEPSMKRFESKTTEELMAEQQIVSDLIKSTRTQIADTN